MENYADSVVYRKYFYLYTNEPDERAMRLKLKRTEKNILVASCNESTKAPVLYFCFICVI